MYSSFGSDWRVNMRAGYAELRLIEFDGLDPSRRAENRCPAPRALLTCVPCFCSGDSAFEHGQHRSSTLAQAAPLSSGTAG